MSPGTAGMRGVCAVSATKMTRICLVTISMLFLFYTSVRAQGPAISLDPILVEKVMRAGQTLTQVINLDNSDKYNEIVLQVSAADVMEDLNGIYHLKPPGSTPHSLAQFIEVSPQRLVIPPGGSAEALVTVSVPRGIAGGRYGAITFTIVPEAAEAETDQLGATLFTFQVASFFEITVEGSNLRREAYVESLSVLPSDEFPQLRPYVGSDAIVFTAAVTNGGNVHIVTRGSLLLTTAEGRTVARHPLGGGRGVILPTATVQLQTVMPRTLAPGDYTARAVIEYGGRRPLIVTTDFSLGELDVKSSAMSQSPTTFSHFSVEPDNLEMTLRPGAFQSAVLQITNHGEEKIDLESFVFPLEFDLYGNLIPVEERAEPLPWIEISPASFSVLPGRTQRIRLTLRPPRELAECICSDILFKSVTDDGSSVEAGINLLGVLGADMSKAGTVRIISAEKVAGGLTVDTLLSNIGAAAIIPRVELVLNQIHPQQEAEEGRIIAGRTETMAAVNLPLGANPVLPGTERLFSFMLPTDLEQGEYQVIIRVDYGGKEPAIGRLGISIGGMEDDQ